MNNKVFITTKCFEQFMWELDYPLFNLLPNVWEVSVPAIPKVAKRTQQGGKCVNFLVWFLLTAIHCRSTPFLLKTSQLIKVYNNKKSFDIVTIFYATKPGKKVFFLSQIFIYLSCSFLIFTIFMGDDHLVYNSTSTLKSFPIPSASSGANCLTV